MAIGKSRLDEIRAWIKYYGNLPSQQGIYRFSNAKSYYEELCQIYKFLTAYKEELEYIEENTLSKDVLDEAIAELEEEIALEYATQDELDDYLTEAAAELTYTPLSSFTPVSEDVATNKGDISALKTRMTTAEGDIDALELSDAGKQPLLTAGENISIVNNVISASGDLSTDWTEVSNKPLINNQNLVTGNNTLASLGIQAELVSGTNIKTVGSTSLLGSGNIDVVAPATLNDYVAKADATGYNDILTSTTAAGLYLTMQDASDDYVNKLDADDTYLSKTDASSTYLTQTGASSTYATKDRTFSNIAVAGTPVKYTEEGQPSFPAWDTNQEYGYYLDVTVSGITANDIISNFVAPTSLTEIIAMYVDTGTNTLRLWTQDSTAINDTIIALSVRSI